MAESGRRAGSLFDRPEPLLPDAGQGKGPSVSRHVQYVRFNIQRRRRAGSLISRRVAAGWARYSVDGQRVGAVEVVGKDVSDSAECRIGVIRGSGAGHIRLQL